MQGNFPGFPRYHLKACVYKICIDTTFVYKYTHTGSFVYKYTNTVDINTHTLDKQQDRILTFESSENLSFLCSTSF